MTVGAVVLVVWYLAVVVWASRPLSENTPVFALDPAAVPALTSHEVACASVLSSDAVDPAEIPVPPEGYGFGRQPCELVHSTGVNAFVINTVLFALAVLFLIGLWLRRSRRTELVAA